MRSATAEAAGSRKSETNCARAESSQAMRRTASEAPRASTASRALGRLIAATPGGAASPRDRGDLRCRADAEPQYEHRDERRFRQRVKAANERIDDRLDRSVPRHQHADRRADDDRGGEAADEIDQRGGAVADEIAAEQQPAP